MRVDGETIGNLDRIEQPTWAVFPITHRTKADLTFKLEIVFPTKKMRLNCRRSEFVPGVWIAIWSTLLLVRSIFLDEQGCLVPFRVLIPEGRLHGLNCLRGRRACDGRFASGQILGSGHMRTRV